MRLSGEDGRQDRAAPLPSRWRRKRWLYSEDRTSRTAYLPEKGDAVIDCLGQRLATLAGMPLAHLEQLQVTDYAHEQRYMAHLDDPGFDGEPRRLKTVFVYLQDDGLADGRCGGATAFYRLRRKDGQPLRVFPRKGNALLWSNIKPDGRRDGRMLHAGEPVTCKESHKTGLNAWFLDSPRPRKRSARPRSRRKRSHIMAFM